MKIFILPSAMEDVAEGFEFYEKQEAGIGDYFLDSIFADIDSLKLYAGIIGKFLASTGCLPRLSRSEFIIKSWRTRLSSAPFSTVAAIQNG